jgi:mono/diheme cytochrome c family protein
MHRIARMLTLCLSTLALDAWAAADAGTEFADTLAQRLVACSFCHGKQGEGHRESEYYPRIAGKPAEYLYRQLVNFRDGRRTYPQMVYMSRHLSDEYLREIATYYSTLRPPYPTPIQPSATRDTLARGEQIARSGDQAKGIPACDSCHGTALTGVLPGVPGLVGLYPDYINGQLGAWRSGLRKATEPDCMARIAQRLRGADSAAVSAYLATLPGMPSSLPAPATRQKLPMNCGSQPPQEAAAVAQARKTRAPDTTRASSSSHGEYLARAGDCIACHTARGGEPFAGGLAMPTPFGTLYTPNITPDPETGIGKWTADDFYRALHDGKSKDGTLLYPAFPFPSYTRVTRADSDAIFAYIRSVAPVTRKNRPHALRFPYNQRKLLIAWRALYFEPGEFRPDPSQSAEWNRGAYLVLGLGHCDACHTSRNVLGATQKGKELAGGLIPLQDWYAPSLTSNREAGLGQWATEDVVALLRTGVSNRGVVFGPMAQVVHDSLQYITEDDTRAMAVYLKSLGTTDAPVPPGQLRTTEAQSRASYESGGRIYDKHCKSCHGANGLGVPPMYPPLADNQAINMEYAVNPIRIVLFGGFPPSTGGNPRPFGMPPFAYTLSDQEVADVVTYMRQSWGNRASAVSGVEVAKYRTVPVD